MQIQTQNQNFKAVKIKGLQPGTKEYKAIESYANGVFLPLKQGFPNFSTKNKTYIETPNNSKLEKNFLTYIKSIVGKNKDITAKIVSDKSAKKAISNWEKAD